MEELLKQIIGRLDRIDNRIDNVERTMATKEDLKHFKETTDAEFQNIKQTMATKEEQLEIKKSINVLEENLRSDVMVLLIRLDHNVKELKSNIKHLDEVQERQQDVLELLSIRSIQQESELKLLQKVYETSKGSHYRDK